MTTRDVTQLAERIKKLDKDAKIQAICRLMSEYSISTGELVEYTTKYGVVSTDAMRLREINQTRKKARKILEDRRRGLAKARKVHKDNKDRLKSIAKADESVNLTLSDMEF